MTYTLTDLFCGAGGSALGASVVNGVELITAANHWQRAIDTHQLNFPDAAHDCADISQVRPQRYRRTDILWASPECTNHSVAKGRKRFDGQVDLFGDGLPDEAAERSRATMWDVPRFAEIHDYAAIIVENVVDAVKWIYWPAFLQSMQLAGYRWKVVYLNSMHAPAVKAPRGPQSRDRIYIVFTKVKNPEPDLEIRPLAYCPTCDEVVRAMQVWKKADQEPWGRYRQQYLYRCPSTSCRFAVVEPFVDAASSIIDWSMRGQRIGDRTVPLKPKTLARIEAGLRKYARPMTFEARGNTFVRTGPDGRPVYARAWPVDQPTATLTTSETRALVVPVEAREGKKAGTVTQPIRTLTTQHENALVVPYYGRTAAGQPADLPMPTQSTVDTVGLAFIAELRGGGSKSRDVRDPLATVTASGNHHMLVRNNGSRGDGGEMCTPIEEPARTLTTKGHQSLVGWPDHAPAVEDCTFRMLEPREIQAAMAFRADYVVTGNRREQVKQLGNGVTPPAAEVLIRAVVDSLERAR